MWCFLTVELEFLTVEYFRLVPFDFSINVNNIHVSHMIFFTFCNLSIPVSTVTRIITPNRNDRRRHDRRQYDRQSNSFGIFDSHFREREVMGGHAEINTIEGDMIVVNTIGNNSIFELQRSSDDGKIWIRIGRWVWSCCNGNHQMPRSAQCLFSDDLWNLPK